MDRLRLYYPAKPYIVTQGWGVFNPFYKTFGWSRHNGEDAKLGADKFIYAPIDGVIARIGNQPTGGGIFIGLMTEPQVFADGEYRILLDFLHCKELLKVEGDMVKIGDKIAIGDNTGAATTGSHTHLQCRRVAYWNKQTGVDLVWNELDKNDANNSFDPSPYWTGIYAVDYEKWLGLHRALISTLSALVAALSAKNK